MTEGRSERGRGRGVEGEVKRDLTLVRKVNAAGSKTYTSLFSVPRTKQLAALSSAWLLWITVMAVTTV